MNEKFIFVKGLRRPVKNARKKKKKPYQPILDKIPDWPVYQLSKNKKKFLEEVLHNTVSRIKELRPTRKQLLEEIEATVYREQNRMKRNRWRVDPADERIFWQRIKDDLLRLDKSAKKNDEMLEVMLHLIVQRYIKEIAGNFRPRSYRFAKRIISLWFSRLLSGARLRKNGSPFTRQALYDKIVPVGQIDMLRKLAKRGTLVMVPTHFSNLDSIVMGWIIHFLGLPAFLYGAGLNLFNVKIFAYFMNSLGAYKIDRRKKNLFYLETLKMYSMITLQRGAHSLFFPGGTRSRSGSIETRLQLGLLSTPIEAQRIILANRKDSHSERFQKIFIIPVTLNYPFVLEAPTIIHDYLHKTGQDRYIPERDKYGSVQLLKFIFKFFTKGSRISVSIGPALDVLGNYVDEEGNSLDTHGRVIRVEDYFTSQGKISVDMQRTKEYTRILSQRIIDEYHRIAHVYASHLVAFAAFEMWQKKHPKLDLFELLRTPEEDMVFEYDEFKETCERLRHQIYKLEKQKKIQCAPHFQGDIDEVLEYGLSHVGIFHVKRPLLKNKKQQIITKDLTVLYYYHNRLANYGLEKFV